MADQKNKILTFKQIKEKKERLFLAAIFYVIQPRISLRSSSTILMGIMLKLSTSTLSTFGVIKAGKLGPSRIFLTPKYSSDRRMATAFCSYHDKIIDNSSSFK